MLLCVPYIVKVFVKVVSAEVSFFGVQRFL